jgi:hypothetical protein
MRGARVIRGPTPIDGCYYPTGVQSERSERVHGQKLSLRMLADALVGSGDGLSQATRMRRSVSFRDWMR